MNKRERSLSQCNAVFRAPRYQRHVKEIGQEAILRLLEGQIVLMVVVIWYLELIAVPLCRSSDDVLRTFQILSRHEPVPFMERLVNASCIPVYHQVFGPKVPSSPTFLRIAVFK
jgi:hypothetical protein